MLRSTQVTAQKTVRCSVVTGIACKALNCVAHDFIILHIVVLSFSDSRVSTRGINWGAVNCHCPRATHTARTMALQRWVESRNYPNDKFISYTSSFNIFVYFPLHFRTPVFQHGASLVYLIVKTRLLLLLLLGYVMGLPASYHGSLLRVQVQVKFRCW